MQDVWFSVESLKDDGSFSLKVMFPRDGRTDFRTIRDNAFVEALLDHIHERGRGSRWMDLEQLVDFIDEHMTRNDTRSLVVDPSLMEFATGYGVNIHNNDLHYYHAFARRGITFSPFMVHDNPAIMAAQVNQIILARDLPQVQDEIRATVEVITGVESISSRDIAVALDLPKAGDVSLPPLPLSSRITSLRAETHEYLLRVMLASTNYGDPVQNEKDLFSRLLDTRLPLVSSVLCFDAREVSGKAYSLLPWRSFEKDFRKNRKQAFLAFRQSEKGQNLVVVSGRSLSMLRCDLVSRDQEEAEKYMSEDSEQYIFTPEQMGFSRIGEKKEEEACETT